MHGRRGVLCGHFSLAVAGQKGALWCAIEVGRLVEIDTGFERTRSIGSRSSFVT
jgi:hypothetical protein